MTITVNPRVAYFRHDGTATLEGLALLRALAAAEARVTALESKLEAIAAITAPAGGGTVDAEARAAISAIIAGAA